MIHGLILKNKLRKGLRPNFFISFLAWFFDIILYIFTILTWIFMGKENCGVPAGATVMFYSNLLSTLLLL